MNNDFDVLKFCLSQYLLKKEKDFKPIKNYQNLFKEFKNQDTVVVNFNYTNTVKHYLVDTNIELIHIHGELENKENPIIFGFAANQQESKKLLIENDNNYVRNIKKFNYLFTENETLLIKHLQSVEFNVFILGHSCGISDNLILNQIFNSENIHKIIPFYFESINGYFGTMVNIDRIIDDYSKNENETKSFNKLVSFPNSYKMPQIEDDSNLVGYVKKMLNERKPSPYNMIF